MTAAWQAEVGFALRLLAAHRLRSAASSLGIAAGVASFVVVLGAAAGARERTLQDLRELGMSNIVVRALPARNPEGEGGPAYAAGFSVREASSIAGALHGVRRWSGVRELRVAPPPGVEPVVLSVAPAFAEILRLRVAPGGRFLTESDARARELVCVLGSGVADAMGENGSPGSSVRMGESICKVVGVLHPRGRRGGRGAAGTGRDLDMAILLPLEDPASSSRADGLTEFVLEMRTSELVRPTLPRLRALVSSAAGADRESQVVAALELLDRSQRSRRMFDQLLGSIAFVLLLTGGVGIMNTMLVSAAERTFEIGIRRAVGAPRGAIARQFMLEGMLLSAGGGLAGVAAGSIAALALGTVWPVRIEVSTLLLPLAGAVIVGCACSIHPAMRAAALDPVEALRAA